MKAIVCEKYGDPLEVLQFKDVEKPVPKDNQVLVKVMASSVNVADVAPVRGAFIARLFGTGLLKPKQSILGTDLAGRVEAVGANVTQFRPGEEVFGAAAGSYAEYVCAREDLLVPKPTNATFEAAAAMPIAAISALQGLLKGQIRAGQKVLVQGASGGVGTFAVQIAKSFGTEVTAVTSPRNLEQARSMGADHVIDYTQEDFTKNGQTYDLILAVNGYHSIQDYKKALVPKGIYVVVGGKLPQIFQSMLFGRLLSERGGKTVGMMGIAKFNQKDLLQLKELLEAGKIRPVIERRYTLSETGQAIRYLEEGHVRGKLVIIVEPDKP